jgi:hypothetical protein
LAARVVLEQHGIDDTHLLGVLLVNFRRTARVSGPLGRREGVAGREVTHEVKLTWGSQRTIVRNPAYRFGLKIVSVEGYDTARDRFDFTLPLRPELE